jgi:valyl-tRNA synthetase
MLHPLMPFITEEIWQRVAPLAGAPRPTIMLAPYPAAGEFPADEDAVRHVEALQAVVLGIRQIRGELDVPHARATPVWVVTERANDADALTDLAPLIARLGNLESVELVRSEAELPPSAIAIVDGRAVLAPFSRLVDDLAAGAARLDKRRARAIADRDRSRARLANSGFVSNAPAEVVAVERERLKELERHADQLEEQLRRLNALIAGSRT